MNNGTNELARYFLSMQQFNFSNPMKETAYFEIKKELDSYFNGLWAWELSDESFINIGNTQNIMTTVTLYTPGKIFTGRSLCKVHDYLDNHLHALVNASETFTAHQVSNNSNNQINNNLVNNNQMTANQIQQQLSQQQEQKPSNQIAENAAQFYNYKDEIGRPADGVPMDNISDNANNELINQLFPQQTAQPQQPQQVQQPLKYTQDQIDRMQNFKKDFNISSDQELVKWINLWNPEYNSKQCITPANIDSFLEWINKEIESLDCLD